MQGVLSSIPQQRNHRDEKLRTDNIHLRVLIGHIHNSVVIQFVVNLKKGNKDCILAALFISVFIQFFEKVFILVLGGGLISFVLHFKHNGDELCTIFTALTVNKVTFTASLGIIVLLKIGVWESRHSDRIELCQAMLLQTFTNHFC